MVSCPDLNGDYMEAFTNETTFDVMSGLYCPYYDAVGQSNSAAVFIIFGISAYVGLVNRSLSVLAIYLVLTFSSLLYLIVWAPFNALIFLTLAGALGFGLFLLYRRIGSNL
tara:strand:+ start:572 stop:904 length:333 start_codon:yes stop_codon:yes gene_type:complete